MLWAAEVGRYMVACARAWPVGNKRENWGWPQSRVPSVHPEVSFWEWERGPAVASQAFVRIKHFW